MGCFWVFRGFAFPAPPTRLIKTTGGVALSSIPLPVCV